MPHWKINPYLAFMLSGKLLAFLPVALLHKHSSLLTMLSWSFKSLLVDLTWLLSKNGAGCDWDIWTKFAVSILCSWTGYDSLFCTHCDDSYKLYWHLVTRKKATGIWITWRCCKDTNACVCLGRKMSKTKLIIQVWEFI